LFGYILAVVIKDNEVYRMVNNAIRKSIGRDRGNIRAVYSVRDFVLASSIRGEAEYDNSIILQKLILYMRTIRIVLKCTYDSGAVRYLSIDDFVANYKHHFIQLIHNMIFMTPEEINELNFCNDPCVTIDAVPNNITNVLNYLTSVIMLVAKIYYGKNKKKCNICCGKYDTSYFSKCGGCSELICYSCRLQMYSQCFVVGKIIDTKSLQCPFCTFVNVSELDCIWGEATRTMALTLNSNQYHTICTMCNNFTDIMNKNCSETISIDFDKLDLSKCLCDRCSLVPLWHLISKGKIYSMCKKCPKCNEYVNRSSGCNHMRCSTTVCNNDWCYKCEKSYKYGDPDCKCGTYA
jgi:hypothetical protein